MQGSNQVATPQQETSKPIRQVAILPWVLRDGTETAMETARKTVDTLFEKINYEIVPSTRVKTVWEEELQHPALRLAVKGKDNYPELPTAKELLALGKSMKVDIVCAGRASWHTKSVWVNLGPKTKAECTVDIIIINVKTEEVVLEAKGVKADSTKSEKGLETAAALLVSVGFTALSGGPKTPHQQRSAQKAIGLAMEPWLKTNTAKKIGS